ncbi:hypothetical protein BFP76_10795 [Amylibacter kogurei]|uniref:Uncharacterized protein n=1 Tax=Paramylibacter kogurei TaxID=1889778 RepID=A0A2G5KB53_9RHOB|nr:polysaccharide biosynthesis/export family protein [Amylibacter kogurei]PIB26736.1 hypothetical protein BFP76_10795 [Amylibacter kogurei]
MLRFISCFLISVFITTSAFAQAGYRVKAGDTLRIEILEDANLNRTVLVLPDGSINFPAVGTMRASGRTVDAITSTLTNALAPNYASTPNIYVSVDKLAPVPAPRPRVAATPKPPVMTNIFVMGEVNTPGSLEVKPGITLLQAIAASGGLTRFAAEKRIELRRTDPKSKSEVIYKFNYKNPRDTNSIAGNTVLGRGDVVVVPTRRLFE